MNPHRSRVAAVFGTRQGSGYLLGPRLVLTAAHVVGEKDTAEAVVFGGVGEVLCDVVWRRKDDACDAALLVARAPIVPDSVSDSFAPLRWGELIRLDTQENCQAIGFPLVQRDERGNLDSEQLSGRVKPGSSILGGRYVLESSGTPPQPTAHRSPWSGLSGAGLFCQGALIGVVITAPTGWHNGRVEAVPVRVIANDRGFRDALGRHGGAAVAVEALDELSDRERKDHEFEVRYRRYVAHRYGQVETLGHGSALGRIVWPLDTAFLALELAETAPRRSPDRSAAEVATGKRVQAALRGRSRILLQGAAGSGKTTLMHWLAVRAAQGDLPSELSQLQNRVPFVIPLRTLIRSGLPKVGLLLDELQYPAADSQPAGWLPRLLEHGRCLLLVDGIDEVQHDQRPRVRSWLEGLLSLYPDTAVVATSRPSAVPDDWLAGYGFTAFSVLPMSPADVGTFIDRWFAAVRESADWGWFRHEADDYRRALRAKVDVRASLMEMAANPRLCTLICAVWLEQRGYLPDGPMSLHRAALDLLLGRRDIQRAIAATEGITLGQGPQMHLLDALALWMTFNGATEISRSRASRIVAADLAQLDVRSAKAEPALRHLLIRSGVLRETASTITFQHSTFQDFFAAHALVDRGHFGFLINHAHDPQYEDVVRMAVGHCPESEASRLLLALVERGDREPDHRTRIHLLATASLEYALRLDPEVRKEVLRRAEALVPPRDDAAADVLAGAGAVVLDLLPDLDGLTDEEARAVVLTACKISGPAAAAVLELFQGHADPAVRERVRWGRNRIEGAPGGAANGSA
ncbi:NACHT domain-containing protein [Streptomyces massasporeus]